MNILMIGGTGFLGSNCAKALRKRHTVYCTGIPGPGIEDESFISLKIQETEKIISLIETKKIDVVMHLVSTLLPNSSHSDYLSDIQNIYVPTVQLVDYCSRHQVKFVFFSSGGAVYGNQNGAFSEDLICSPISYYGLSKLNMEQMISFYHAKGLEYLIIRPSNPYGPGQNIYGRQGLIAVTMGKILNNQPIEIWGDGLAVKDYIYIDDFVHYVVTLLETERAWNGTYNIGSGIGTSVNQVIEAFTINSIQLPQIQYVATKAMDVSHMILNCTKLNSIVKWSCKPLVEGIACFWNFLNQKTAE